MSHTNVAPLRPLDFVGHRPGTPLAGEWTEEMAAALLVELMHQVGMRDGCILADQAAFDSEHREAWLSLQVQTLLDQNALNRVQVASLDEARVQAVGAQVQADEIEEFVSSADAHLDKGVKYAEEQLKSQSESPEAVVEKLAQHMRDALGAIDEAEDEMKRLDKTLDLVLKNLDLVK